MDDGNALGEYLQARRGLVTPEQLGLPGGGRRRVAGLRREEVALLAGISADYYLRLERGRDRHPSQQVLEALARVLQLDEVETAYLLGLGSPPPRKRPARRQEVVPARIRSLLDAVDVPAFVEGRYFDVLASNPLAVALNPRLVPGQNRLRSLLLDPEERAFHDDWERGLHGIVAALRRAVGEHPDDPRAIELIGELSIASGRFRELWARHDVRELAGGTASVQHPSLGPLRLHREKLPVDGVVLVLYYAEAGSADAEKLVLLRATVA